MTQPITDSTTLGILVEKLGYRVELSLRDRAAILALPFVPMRVERHHYIVREYDPTSQACLLLSGYAVRSKVVASGARQIVSVHMNGELVDLQNSLLERADHSVQTLTDCRIALVRREEILKIAAERPMVGRAMWLDTLVDASIFREWVANVGRRDARTRIAHLLCEFSLRLKVAGLGENSHYELPMTQEQLADATGLTPVHVNRTIRLLEKDKLIERIMPRSIHIGDWRKLAEAGDFDSNYLHLRQDEPALMM
ncbi:MAG: Crp/Fnr family transcriptional regulator [Alphaproteobacteria bacterium]